VFAERKMAFLILDVPEVDTNLLVSQPGNDAALKLFPSTKNAALYYPYLKYNDPLADLVNSSNPLSGLPKSKLPPSGYVAGIFSRTDLNRGVWKAPAGLEASLRGTAGVVTDGHMTDNQNGALYSTLNQTPVNCVREFRTGTVVYGARTIVGNNPAFQDAKYVPVRRMTLFIEQTLLQNLTWVVFEPNDEPLWLAIRDSIGRFMKSLFDQGAFQGAKPSEAFQVLCDRTTTTQDDINKGIVNIIVAFAPLKPAEFVIVKIAQLAGQTQV
jgi:uncharacterized protein